MACSFFNDPKLLAAFFADTFDAYSDMAAFLPTPTVIIMTLPEIVLRLQSEADVEKAEKLLRKIEELRRLQADPNQN